MNIQFAVAAPEIFLLSATCVILVIDLFLPQRLRDLTYWLAIATVVITAALTARSFPATPLVTFNGMFVDDALSDVVKLVVQVAVFGVFIYSRDYARERGIFRGEYFVLGLFGLVGMMVMASANHFLSLYLGLELLSLCLYTMVAFQRDSALATEAAMKYFVLGALSSGILLYGLSLLYGLTGTLQIDEVQAAVARMPGNDVVLILALAFIVVSLCFKLGAVPFHMWVPDVYHGAPTSSTIYIGTAPKVAGFALIMRLLVGGLDDLSAMWQDMLVIVALLSVILGNLVAIAQSNLKRMLAYSTIAHMGFFFMGVLSATPAGYSAAMFYIMVYALMSLGAFGMILMLARAGFEADRLEDFKGLNQRSPWQAAIMLLLMFSMAGVPPTVGFYAKLSVIQALIQVELLWLAVVAVLSAVVGAFYYLRVVRLMYFEQPEETGPVLVARDFRAVLAVNGLAVVAVMPWVGSLMALCGQAVEHLLR